MFGNTLSRNNEIQNRLFAREQKQLRNDFHETLRAAKTSGDQQKGCKSEFESDILTQVHFQLDYNVRLFLSFEHEMGMSWSFSKKLNIFAFVFFVVVVFCNLT